MRHGVLSHIHLRNKSGDITWSALATVLIAVTPKCPLCWMAFMSVLGIGSVINYYWLQPLVVMLLLLSVSALLIRAWRQQRYSPFWLGLVAALAMYLCKFTLDYTPGIYLSGAALLGASIWNTLPKRRAAHDAQCGC